MESYFLSAHTSPVTLNSMFHSFTQLPPTSPLHIIVPYFVPVTGINIHRDQYTNIINTDIRKSCLIIATKMATRNLLQYHLNFYQFMITLSNEISGELWYYKLPASHKFRRSCSPKTMYSVLEDGTFKSFV